jgi:16S rRNA (adenine1518-N6/adenine1519-N6)-dimethyltransferase
MTHPGELLKREKIYAGKELGQNFLVNPSSAQMIIDKTAISAQATVLEIGSGLGALTISIANRAARVIAVEKDRRLIGILEEELSSHGISNVEVLNQDVLKLDIDQIAGDKKLVVIGNLPYNISSQILFKLVQKRRYIETAFLMFQKELAKRIIASPGGRNYSRLSAVVQYGAEVGFLMDVKPSSFFPRPEVDSTILKFSFCKETDFSYEMEHLLFDVIKGAFSKRRKTLKNALTKGEMGLTREFVVNALEQANIQPERRAETLSVEEFKTLAKAVRGSDRET